MRTLVLGATGMLGSMVFDYLCRHTDLDVVGTARKRSEKFELYDVYQSPEDLEQDGFEWQSIDYVINCIGITKPYCHDDNMNEVQNAIHINSAFPHKLNAFAREKELKVLQIATDCVYSGRKGQYIESDIHDALDAYGKTKSLGEVRSGAYLNLRCSIIGPEIFNKAFLLEWFMSQPKGASVNGFTNHHWNGVTTLQFAKLCAKIIEQNKFDELAELSNVHHFLPNTTVSKYELLKTFDEVFERGLTVMESKGGANVVDRTLNSEYSAIRRLYPDLPMATALTELNDYIQASEFYDSQSVLAEG